MPGEEGGRVVGNDVERVARAVHPDREVNGALEPTCCTHGLFTRRTFQLNWNSMFHEWPSIRSRSLPRTSAPITMNEDVSARGEGNEMNEMNILNHPLRCCCCCAAL